MALPEHLTALLGAWIEGDYLNQQGLLQIEGAEAVRWLLNSNLHIHAIIGKASTLTSLEPEITPYRQQFPQQVHELSRSELAKALNFRFDRGVVALAHMPIATQQSMWMKELARHQHWGLIFADSIHDPSNIGTIIRSGRCLGCDGIILGPGCAQPLSRRSIRAGVGHPLRWPALSCDNAAECLTQLAELDADIIAGHRGPRSVPINELAGVNKRWVLVVGNEDRGIHPELLPHCNLHCHIPMSNDCDSLNVGAAMAILAQHFAANSPRNSPSCLTAHAPQSSR